MSDIASWKPETERLGFHNSYLKRKPRSLFAGFLFLCLINSAFALNLLSPAYNWRSPNQDTKISWRDGKLTFTSTRSAGGLYNTVPLNGRENRLLIIKMRTSRRDLGEVSWTTGQERFTPRNNRPFYLRNGLHYMMIGREKAPLEHLLLFTGSGPGTTEISEFKLVEGTPLELGLAGWQEFWGPVGREPDGFNWLVIRSPRLFGRTINFYLNIFLAIFLIYAWRSGKRREFLLVLLAAWLLLEGSSLLNNWISFQRDAKYFGQPLEKKHAMINTSGFYRFLQAADKRLPPGAPFKLKRLGQEDIRDFYDDLRARYYLYPQLASAETTNIIDFKRDQWN